MDRHRKRSFHDLDATRLLQFLQKALGSNRQHSLQGQIPANSRLQMGRQTVQRRQVFYHGAGQLVRFEGASVRICVDSILCDLVGDVFDFLGEICSIAKRGEVVEEEKKEVGKGAGNLILTMSGEG